MFKIFAAGATLAALAAGVSRVSMTSDEVRIGDRAVTAQVLQLHDTGGSQILASSGVVESLGGEVDIALDGGRTVTLEPGVRLTRADGGWKLSTHGRRTITLLVGGKTILVDSPAQVTAGEDGWTVAGQPIDGTALRASVARDLSAVPALVTRVAEESGTSGDGGGADTTVRHRRLFVEDPVINSESADDEPLVITRDKSPSGIK